MTQQAVDLCKKLLDLWNENTSERLFSQGFSKLIPELQKAVAAEQDMFELNTPEPGFPRTFEYIPSNNSQIRWKGKRITFNSPDDICRMDDDGSNWRLDEVLSKGLGHHWKEVTNEVNQP